MAAVAAHRHWRIPLRARRGVYLRLRAALGAAGVPGLAGLRTAVGRPGDLAGRLTVRRTIVAPALAFGAGLPHSYRYAIRTDIGARRSSVPTILLKQLRENGHANRPTGLAAPGINSPGRTRGWARTGAAAPRSVVAPGGPVAVARPGGSRHPNPRARAGGSGHASPRDEAQQRHTHQRTPSYSSPGPRIPPPTGPTRRGYAAHDQRPQLQASAWSRPATPSIRYPGTSARLNVGDGPDIAAS
jgi:hypothetical protein